MEFEKKQRELEFFKKRLKVCGDYKVLFLNSLIRDLEMISKELKDYDIIGFFLDEAIILKRREE